MQVKDYLIRQLIIVCLLVNVVWPKAGLLLKVDLPIAIQLLGVALALAALALRQWAYAELKDNWSNKVACPNTLTTTGPYRYVRHPVYVSYLFMAMAAFLATGSITLFLLGVAFFAADKIRAAEEEKLLAEKFDQRWLDHTAKVGRFVPLPIVHFAQGATLLLILLCWIIGAVDETYAILAGKSFTIGPFAQAMDYLSNGHHFSDFFNQYGP